MRGPGAGTCTTCWRNDACGPAFVAEWWCMRYGGVGNREDGKQMCFHTSVVRGAIPRRYAYNVVNGIHVPWVLNQVFRSMQASDRMNAMSQLAYS